MVIYRIRSSFYTLTNGVVSEHGSMSIDSLVPILHTLATSGGYFSLVAAVPTALHLGKRLGLETLEYEMT